MKTVPLHGKKAAGRVALVDDEDYDLVMQYRWHVQEGLRQGHLHGPYAHSTIHRPRPATPIIISMHKLITGYVQTDHRDHDGLNNQRSNLRPATHSQNGANQRKQAGRSSQFKGVCWSVDKRWNSAAWVSWIQVNGKGRYLGRYSSEEAAARAYDAAAREAFGEYASLNFEETEEDRRRLRRRLQQRARRQRASQPPDDLVP